MALMQKATEAARIDMLDAHRTAIDGVAQVVTALQDIPDDVRFLKDRIVSNLLWVVTEYKPGTKHKVHGVRWRTPAAHSLVEAKHTKTVRHEHVIERQWMIEFLHRHTNAIQEALWNYPACLVTVAEHTALGQTLDWGWRRYLTAHLEVIDAVSGKNLDLALEDRMLREHYASLGADID